MFIANYFRIVLISDLKGFIFQNFNLVDELNVMENVELPLIFSGKKRRERREKSTEILDRLKMGHRAKHYPQKLSGGQQQRLCIARAIAVKPEVILMDEPCSALDPKGTEAVEELIWELRDNYTILIVTHNMAQARRASEECIFMLMGKVVEHTETGRMFVTPEHQETADYIEGRYG